MWLVGPIACEVDPHTDLGELGQLILAGVDHQVSRKRMRRRDDIVSASSSAIGDPEILLRPDVCRGSRVRIALVLEGRDASYIDVSPELLAEIIGDGLALHRAGVQVPQGELPVSCVGSPPDSQGLFVVGQARFGEIARWVLSDLGYHVTSLEPGECRARLGEDGVGVIRWAALGRAVCARWQADARVFDAVTIGRKLAARARTAPPEPATREVLAPGEVREPGEDPKLDFGGCELPDGTLDLAEGDLVLGRWAFRRAADEIVEHGPARYASPSHLRRGVVLCAPGGMGKSHLLVRWAAAARRAGYSVLLIDVKGDMADEYGAELGVGEPDVMWFSSEARAALRRPDVNWCRINFLEGLCWPPAGGLDASATEERLDIEWAEIEVKAREVADAVLESAGQSAKQDATFYANRLRWLTGLVSLTILDRFYDTSEPSRCPDLHDLWAVIQSRDRLVGTLARVTVAEHEYEGGRGPGPPYTAESAEQALAYLLSRSSNEDFIGAVTNVQTALEPFGRALKAKTRESGSGPLLRLERLLTGSDPLTAVFAARSADGQVASLLLDLAMRRVPRLVDARLQLKGHRAPLLLLLDEAARIPSFDPYSYATFNRAADAGVVLAYQGVTQIGRSEDVNDLLGVVGLHVHLGAISGPEAREAVLAALGTRRVPITRRSTATGASGSSETSATEMTDVPRLGRVELDALQHAGRHPALVVINPLGGSVAHPRALLTDLNDEVLPPIAPPALRQMPWVRRLARGFPDGERTAELTQLAAFATGSEPYCWIRGDAVAGKSTLLAALCAQAPAKVDVVFYFLDRTRSDADSAHARPAIAGQLFALLESGPAAKHEQELWWTAAAGALAQRGRHLLMVIDGIDNDLGPQAGQPSVAALIGELDPVANAHILIASRRGWTAPDDAPAFAARWTDVRPMELAPGAVGQRRARNAKSTLERLLA